MFSLASPKEEFLISSHERRWRILARVQLAPVVHGA